MKKLEYLSADQEKLLVECADYWVRESLLAGDGMDAEAARSAVRFWYKIAGLAKPEVLIADSPEACQFALKEFKGKPEKDPASRRLAAGWVCSGEDLASIEQTIKHKLSALVWSRADRIISDLVEGDLRYRVEFEICSRVGMPVKIQAWSRVCRQIKTNLGPFYEDFSSWGLAWLADWYCYYDFWGRMGIASHPLLELLLEQVKAGAFISILLDGFAVLSRRPAAVRRNGYNELHDNSGPAIEWRDGCRFYFLNGMATDERIITAPGRELDPGLLLKAKNAEERRELVRKIGIERICRELNARTVDRWNGYELLELPLPDMAIRAKYLKMRNPSIGVYHLEGVPPEINTCLEALSWRIGGRKWNPAKLT